MIQRRPRRRGYALLLIVIFVVLLMSLLGVTWRCVASAMRVASTHSLQVQRDDGSLEALARAMRLLETGLPPNSPYVCGVLLNTPVGDRSYTVTFTLHEDATWSVESRPAQTGENPQPMPDSFAPANP